MVFRTANTSFLSFRISLVSYISSDNPKSKGMSISSEENPLAPNAANTASPSDTFFYAPLYRTAVQGDWKGYTNFFDSHSSIPVDVVISSSGKTVLHVAAALGQTEFVVKLISSMKPEMLEKVDSGKRTALFLGVTAGNYEVVEAMFKKNKRLAEIYDDEGNSPILESALIGHRKLLELFYKNTANNPTASVFMGEAGVSLLKAIITAEFYDIAISLVELNPEVATLRSEGSSALDVLAQKSSSFKSGAKFRSWEWRIYSAIHVQDSKVEILPLTGDGTKGFATKNDLEKALPIVQSVTTVSRWNLAWLVPIWIKRIYDFKLKHRQAVQLVKCLCKQVPSLGNETMIFDLLKGPFLLAAECGVVEFITVAYDIFPELIWIQNEKKYTILHYCIKYRQDKVFRFLHEKKISPCRNSLASYQVEHGNTILHLAAELAPQERLKNIAGAALQMQSEIQWYKAVEQITKPKYRELKNTLEVYDSILKIKTEGCKPQDLFLKEHKGLLAAGEAWMTRLASSCSVVGSLITTIMFAASATNPGIVAASATDPGIVNDYSDPPPFYSFEYYWFAIFVAFSLITSMTSVVIFLSALTSRYSVDDFLVSLPRKVIFGLGTLFISIASMFMAFIISFYLQFNSSFWAPLFVVVLISIPAILFVFQQYPLFVELIESTYMRNVFSC